jgi:endonuclease III
MTKKQSAATIVLTELKRLFPNPKPSLDFSNHWELVVAVVLSAQTTDKQVNVVTKKLFCKYNTLEKYLKADPEIFTQDLKHVGLYKTKAKNILAAAKLLKTTFKGILPKTIKELMLLPGVGRKTANVVLGNAYGIVEGIAVDTHVTRLAQKFGLTKQTDPKKIEQELMTLFPQEEWFLLTMRLIEYGREYSPARKKEDNTDPISLKQVLTLTQTQT